MRARCSPEEQDRAMVFIGHSFGGLLIKQALLTACERGSPYKNVSDRVVGVIFLAVPHRGSNKLLHRLGWALAALYKLVGSRTDLLNLVRGSPELDRLHDQFLSSYKAIDCMCFYECVPEYKFGIPIGLVVDESSAKIPGKSCNLGLEADHRGINKFESNADQNYIKVLAKLKVLVNKAPDVLKRGNCPSLPVASWPVP